MYNLNATAPPTGILGNSAVGDVGYVLGSWTGGLWSPGKQVRTACVDVVCAAPGLTEGLGEGLGV